MQNLLIALSLVFLGCSSTPKNTTKTAKVLQLIDDHFEKMIAMDPLFATSIGDHRFDDQLGITISKAYQEKSLQLINESLAQIRALNCQELDESTTLTCETFVDDLETGIELEKADISHLTPFNQFDSFFSNFAELATGSSYVTFDNEKDYENFLSRLNRVPEYIDTMIANMKIGVKSQITTPRVLVQKAIKQLDDLLVKNIEESVFYKPLLSFDKKISKPVSVDLKARYTKTIQEKIYPAYARLLEYAKTQYLPFARQTHGLMSIPGGRKNYQALVRYHTTMNVDPGEIMQVGLDEVARIDGQFEEVKNAIGFTGSRKAFFKSLRSNANLFPFKSAEGVLNAYRAIQGRLSKTLPEHFRLMPKAKFEVREVEKFKAESASEAYQNPSPDGTRPGIFWVPVPDAEKYNSKSMEAMFLHEAMPGHHFQIAIQQELDLPRYRRFTGNNAYVEGWGLYAESLGKELGLYTDPYQWVGRLEMEMHRAIRLVVDVGMHWKGWTRERAIQYSLDHEPGDEAGIVSEIERYLAIPAQALSYKMGERKLQLLKSYAKEKLGTAYDDRDFHDQVLKDGALPLTVLDRKIRLWVDKHLKN